MKKYYFQDEHRIVVEKDLTKEEIEAAESEHGELMGVFKEHVGYIPVYRSSKNGEDI